MASILKQNEEVCLLEVLDERGYSLLHEACFHNDERMAKIIMRHATETMKSAQVTAFINIKTTGDGFTALHFCSFKGNTTLCQLLLDNGADKYAVNNFGINVVHVAAQGDQPISIYFFKQIGLDLRSRDNRGSTPMHWACYSKSEIALVYLLSWVPFLDD